MNKGDLCILTFVEINVKRLNSEPAGTGNNRYFWQQTEGIIRPLCSSLCMTSDAASKGLDSLRDDGLKAQSRWRP
jgi:hypothetical protein